MYCVLRHAVVSAIVILLRSYTVCSQSQTPVQKFGKLTAKGKYLLGSSGDTVQLRGVSLFWSQWMGPYYNQTLVRWLKEDWKATVVRAAMGVQQGGYETNPYEEREKVKRVIKGAIQNGIYVIVDYHSHEAHLDPELAIRFFTDIAKTFGYHPNLIYEIYNEPLQDASWSSLIKPYANKVIKAIRTYDNQNLIIVGTRQWSQMVSEAASDPVEDRNTAYALHFYAGTHKEWLREETLKAIGKNQLIFVTEFGTCNASGNNDFNPEETKVWWSFLDEHHISWCNWSVADKEETASVLMPGSNYLGKWKETALTSSGKLVRDEIRSKNTVAYPEK